MDDQLRAGRFLAPLVRGASRELAEIKRQHEHLAAVVDQFYSVAGDKGWVFLSRFNVVDIESAVGNGAQAVDTYLSEWFMESDNLQWLVANAVVTPGLLERSKLIELAQADTLAGRYYSAINLLLSIMDGFVSNENRAQRAGLHAREPDTMAAWDSVVGHSAGLVSALRLYGQPFGRLQAEPVVNLYRHGIVHGMVVDYDNPFVSGKAWNLLAALVEWTRANDKAKEEKPAPPTVREALAKVARNTSNAERLKSWKPRSWTADSGDPLDQSEPIVVAVHELFDGWANSNWGAVAARIDDLRGQPEGARAGEMRTRFAPVPVERWTLVSYSIPSPQFADVVCELVVDGESTTCKTKWFFATSSGEFQFELEPEGTWRSIHTYPHEYGVGPDPE